MSNTGVVAKRYAKALWGSVKNGSAEEFLKNLSQLSELLKEDSNLNNLAKSPIFSSEEKLKVFSEIFKKLSFSTTMTHFLELLVEKDRFAALPEICEEFRILYLNSNKVKEAQVESAFELSEKQKEQIAEVIEAALDTKVNLDVIVNPALVAGIVVHVDGRSIDASLMSNLKNLKEELLIAEA